MSCGGGGSGSDARQAGTSDAVRHGRHAGKLEFYRSAARPSRNACRVRRQGPGRREPTATVPDPQLLPLPAPNHLRIIGGRHRGRRIGVPDAPGLRPTPDRVRETLFNWLGQDLPGARTLDLYTGTGILTLEACSRGAALAVAVDSNPALIRKLRAAAAAMGIDAIETHVGDALAFAGRETRSFDVIFADPPFAEDPWPLLFAQVTRLLAPEGRLYAEAGRMLSPPPGLSILRHARAGQVHYHLLAPAAPP